MKYLLLFCLIVEVLLTCLIPHSKTYFYNGLEAKAWIAWIGLAYYVGILFLLDVVQNFKPLFITYVSNIKRKILTGKYEEKESLVNNREQRLQEDVKFYTNNSVSVYSEYFISGAIALYLILENYNYPGLIAGSIIYSLICIGSAYLFKPKMIKTEKAIQQVETDFRTSFNNGARLNWSLLETTLKTNLANAWVKFNYGLCVKLQTCLMTLLPFGYLLPMYLTEHISLGEMMGRATIFSLLVVNISIIVNLFTVLMQAQASKERLEEI